MRNQMFALPYLHPSCYGIVHRILITSVCGVICGYKHAGCFLIHLGKMNIL